MASSDPRGTTESQTGEITEYAIELTGDRQSVPQRPPHLSSRSPAADMPTGVGGATNAEYVPNHIVSSRMTLHKIYHDAKRPSHLLLPIIPQG